MVNKGVPCHNPVRIKTIVSKSDLNQSTHSQVWISPSVLQLLAKFLPFQFEICPFSPPELATLSSIGHVFVNQKGVLQYFVVDPRVLNCGFYFRRWALLVKRGMLLERALGKHQGLSMRGGIFFSRRIDDFSRGWRHKFLGLFAHFSTAAKCYSSWWEKFFKESSVVHFWVLTHFEEVKMVQKRQIFHKKMQFWASK